MRFPAIAAGVIAVAATLIPASALAAPTAVVPSLPIFVNAAGSTDNDLTITYKQVVPGDAGYWAHLVSDEAGIVAKPGGDYQCFQRGSTTAECPDTTSADQFDQSKGGQGEDFTILLRGGADDLFIKSRGDFEAYGGAGNDLMIGNSERTPGVGHIGDELSAGTGKDIVSGGAGPDLVGGGGGKDRLIGGAGRDDLSGGGGNDRLLARDGTRDRFISCGGGDRDVALLDGKDPQPTGCEIVRRG